MEFWKRVKALMNMEVMSKGKDLPEGKFILCIDFDGVLHSYTSGWQGAKNIPGPPVRGALQWLNRMIDSGKFDIYIYSSRGRYLGGRRAMRKWLLKSGLWPPYIKRIRFSTRKPPALLTIDDRVFLFEGRFPSVREILEFKPWYRR